ncbi:MAG: multidrug efflux SMR transporter [Burkholderiales bacterium]|jgi:spermidine export protein MdtJ|nr:multidrug efflux SMR transporter [Burkholderiales bacterium]
MFHWLMLFVAIVAEVLGTTALRWSPDHAPVVGHVVVAVLIVTSYTCLSIAMRRVAMGVAYAIWEGVGLVLLAGLSWALFDEAVTPGQAIAFATILAGVWLLKTAPAAPASHAGAPTVTAAAAA